VRQVIDSIGKSLSKFLEDPDPLIREVSQRLGISEGVVREYLLRSVKYVVDDEVIEGIDKELEVFGLPNCLSYLRLGIK
jgi:predicted solute-binding protein